MTIHARRRLRRLLADDSGQTLIVVGVAIIMLLGMAAFAIDVGAVLNAHRQLQASTDAAATAAAQELSDATKTRTAITAKAQEYSAVAGQKNAYTNLPGVTIATTYRCLTSVGLTTPCTNVATANALTVTSSTAVPLFFARVLGFTSMNISATATATMKSGVMPPFDVIIVLDTTGSMSGSPISQAKAGIRTLLGAMWPCAQGVVTCGGGDPPVDKVGLFIYPGLSTTVSGNVAREYDCNGSTHPVTANYSASPIYEIIAMTNDYRTSTVATLNQNSNYVKAVDGRAGCPGLETVGGSVTGYGSYFASPIAAAQSKLVSAGRSNVQNVIIFVSDGDANEYTGGPTDPCQQAVNAAVAAKTAGTWVYSIGYGVPSSGGCVDDPTSITALQTMQRINSDYPLLTTGKFFNSPSGSSLTATFQKIATDLTTTRVVDDSTP